MRSRIRVEYSRSLSAWRPIVQKQNISFALIWGTLLHSRMGLNHTFDSGRCPPLCTTALLKISKTQQAERGCTITMGVGIL